jgi:type III restriction enzyme
VGKFVIDKLIINSPYEEPKEYWKYNAYTRLFEREKGRRPAGYLIASERSKSYDDPGEFRSIELVNEIRPKVIKWREEGYPGVTGVTKRLLDHWYNPDERRDRRFFFCQLEAIETLIWLVEAPEADKVGIREKIQGDGGPFNRLCSKMATGSGKTIVMAMLIAWQVLNKVVYPQDTRFSKSIFVVSPGLTVKNRLGVLVPTAENNYYDEFNIIPPSDRERLRLGKVMIRNWQSLGWDSAERIAKRKSVDKRGPKSDEAYVREVLEDMAGTSNIIVINDEAHHAWRIVPGEKLSVSKEEKEEATVWISGLDRIHKSRNILTCYDFSATPFVPYGKKSTEEALYGWIVSDFGLNDAIESGLVKTPRIVVRDDAVPDTKNFMSKLYHIYAHEKEDLNRKAEEFEPLPQLVTNAYDLLGEDWRKTKENWQESHYPVPPVMISVVNRTETAARVEYAFAHRLIHVDDLCDPQKMLHIDSKVLEMAESSNEAAVEDNVVKDGGEEEPVEKKLTRKELAEMLRRKVDTVGQQGKPGEQIQNVISVGMLSEGWDAKTVTHIMGLRAFTSQLLCEQVVGRGLRRTTYDVDKETGLFAPEYVNIFGVPFTFLPHESTGEQKPVPPPPGHIIKADNEKREFEIKWPNLIRVDHTYRTLLKLDMDKVNPLVLDAKDTVLLAELAAVVDGKPNFESLTQIDLDKLSRIYRNQRIIFEIARDSFSMMKGKWKGDDRYLMAQLVRIIQDFINSDKLKFAQTFYGQDELRRRILIMLNMSRVSQHIAGEIKHNNAESIVPVLDPERPVRSTGDMQPWWTSRPALPTKKSHINLIVADSAWEATEAFRLDNSKDVSAWVKNDHLGFEIVYLFNGVIRKYRPDFIVKLRDGRFLILEVKGQETFQDKVKRDALEEWAKAVNQDGSFGTWLFAVSKDPADIEGLLQKLFTKGINE